MMNSLILLFLVFFISTSSGYKILGILPFCSNSHYNIGFSILKTLVDAGHEITAISPYPRKQPIKNYTDIDASSVLENFKKGKKLKRNFVWMNSSSFYISTENMPDAFKFEKLGAIDISMVISKMGADLVDAYMQQSNVKKFLKENKKFDFCIFESFNADALLVILLHHHCLSCLCI